MAEDTVLHFTLGPVQSFVAQARRTRDLWAGSFLLSWLSGVAMQTISCDGKQIIFPAVKHDPLFVAIAGKGDQLGNRHGPYIGSLPNRFKARVAAGSDATFLAERAAQAAQEAWWMLAEEVWEEFVKPVAARQQKLIREIWERQIGGFWEIAWVAGPEPEDGSDGAWLDRRKNWRTNLPPTEGGDHCMLMGDWQEISGLTRYRQRRQQKAFWDALRRSAGRTQLRDGERLCAIALVKRLFPILPEEALLRTLGWVPGDAQRSIRNWPSVSYMSAVHWIRHAAATLPHDCAGYVALATEILGNDALGEYATRIEALEALELTGAERSFLQLDGALYFADGVRAVIKEEIEEEQKAKQAEEELTMALAALAKAEPADVLPGATEGLGPASPFFGTLLMDGDSVGGLLQSHSPERISEALSAFTGEVDRLIKKHNGVAIYAGGDDVLALFPMEDILPAALDLRQAYGLAFTGVEILEATTSAGIVFAHYHTPLRVVLDEAHRLIEDVAKNGNGRDSLAVSVVKGAGRTIDWVSTWQADGSAPVDMVLDLSRRFHADREFSSSFFYNVRARYADIFGGSVVLKNEEIAKFMSAEYTRVREASEKLEFAATPGRDAEAVIRELLVICQRHFRQGQPSVPVTDRGSFDISGAMLVRFLAGEGLWTVAEGG